MNLQPRQSQNRFFWALCIMGVFAILSSTMSKSPVLKPFASSLGAPTDWVGIVAAASTIPGILVSLPAASLSDILGRRRFLLLAGFIFASAPFLYFWTGDWRQLILVRFYHGFATAIFVPVAEASIAEAFPAKRGERISFFSSMTYVGRVIAPTLGGYVLFITDSNFRILYSVVAVVGVIAFVSSLTLFNQKKRSKIARDDYHKRISAKTFQGWNTVIKNRGVLAVSVVQACLYYSYGAFEFYLAGYLPEVAHLDALSTGLIITSIVAVAIVARPYMGRVSDKIGRRTPIVFGCLLSSLPLFLIAFTANFWILLTLAVVYGVGFASVTASAPAMASEFSPKEHVGTSMGFLSTTMDIGQTLGPIISGFVLATSLQYVGVFSSLAAIVLFSCATFAFLTSRKNVRKAKL